MKYLEFSPEIPFPLWLVLAGLAAGLWVWIVLRRRGRVAVGRWAWIVTFWAVAVLLVLGVLLNPTWIERIPPPEGKPLLTILLDRSAGMATEDETLSNADEKKTSRWQKASTMTQRIAEELGDYYEVRVRAFAERSEPIEPEKLAAKLDEKEAAKETYRPTGRLTDIAGSLEEAVDEDRPQGQAVLLLSDGCHNGTSGTAALWESVEKIRAMNVPVYTKSFGTQTEVRDLAVSLDNPQELALSGGQLLSGVTVRRRGMLTDRATVRLSLDGQELAQQELRFDTSNVARTVFPIRAEKSGLFQYEVTVDPRPGEVTEANNRGSLLVRVVDEPVRVLLLEGKPFWDTKFLIRTLASDMSIDLTSLVRLRDDRFMLRHITRTPAEEKGPDEKMAEGTTEDNQASQLEAERKDDWKIFPSAEAFFAESGGLDGYLVVVLGRDADVFLTEDRVTELKCWVGQHEGALVCFRGPPASRIGERLAEMLPVRWTPGRESEYQVTLSEAGTSASWLTAIGVSSVEKTDVSEGAKEGDSSDPFADLPPLCSSILPERPGPLAVVLAQRSGSPASSDSNEGIVPVISWQPFGIGRVVVVEGAGMWRWAFLPENQQREDDVHALLWRSLLRRLVSNVTLLPNQKAAISTDRLTFRPGEPIAATLLARAGEVSGGEDEDKMAEDTDRATSTTSTTSKNASSLTVVLSGDALRDSDLKTFQPVPQGETPGRFRVLLGRLAPGRFELTVFDGNRSGKEPLASTWFEVQDDLRERLDVQSQPGLLKKIADQTGGKLLEEEDPGDLSEEFDRHLSSSRPERLSRHTAWDRWWVLMLAMGSFATAWTLRRRSGLV